jgi:hypothetical protein
VARGPMMDSVMGMTVLDFIEICHRFRLNEGEMERVVTKFFVRGEFLMTRSLDRVLSISVPPGCALNFRTWLGLQPGFDSRSIMEVLLSRIFRIEDWEMEEDSCIIAELPQYT